MKKNKATDWEMLSEGILTAGEIENLQDKKWPITLGLVSIATGIMTKIKIIPVRGPAYNVTNHITGTEQVLNKKPYKYLSCAVRRAINEYKGALRTRQYRILTK